MLEKDCMVLISIVLSSKWCRCWWTFAVNFDADSVCSLLLRALLSRYQVILKGWSPVVEVHIVWTLIPSWMSSPKLNGVMRGGTTQLKWGEREKWMVFKAAHNLAFVFIFGSSHTDASAVFDSIQSISTLYCSNNNRFSSVFKYGHRLRGWRNRNNFVCANEKLSQRSLLIMSSRCNRTTFGIKNQLNFRESCNRWDFWSLESQN